MTEWYLFSGSRCQITSPPARLTSPTVVTPTQLYGLPELVTIATAKAFREIPGKLLTESS
jgi:hypothetical protein